MTPELFPAGSHVHFGPLSLSWRPYIYYQYMRERIYIGLCRARLCGGVCGESPWNSAGLMMEATIV